VLVLLLAGCSSGSKHAAATTTSTSSASATSTSTTAASTSTSTGSTTSTTTASKDGGNGDNTSTTVPDNQNPEGGLQTSTVDSLPDGTHYGYIKGITDGLLEGRAASLIDFDKVTYLTGQAAVDAAHAAGDLPPDQNSLPNDYYLVNDNPQVRTLAVSPDATVSVVKGGNSAPVPSDPGGAAATAGLYKIQITNTRGVSVVTSIEGVFLP